MRVFLKIYKEMISPIIHAFSVMFTGQANMGCRFVPTCSEYFVMSVEKHGAIKGGMKGVGRICRCHPFSKSEGFDPV